MPKIYVADDEQNIRELIGSFLEKEGFEVHLFETGDQLFLAFLEDACDLVVLDVMMPGSDGFSIAKRLRSKSEVPIILLTARDSDRDLIDGFATGADDYFTKPFSPVKLVLRVKATLKRQAQVKAKSSELSLIYGDLLLSLADRTALYQKEKIKLTNTEFELLKVLMEKADEAVSRDFLLASVWGYEADVETRVTDDTIKRLRKKLRQASSQVIVETVWGYGFKLTKK